MKRSTLIALIAFLVLIVATVVYKKQKFERGIVRLTLTALEDVDALELSFPAKEGGAEATKVVLKREAAKWLVNGRLANQELIQNFLKTIGQITSDNWLTASSAKYGDYGVAEGQGAKITFSKKGKKLVQLVFGHKGEGIFGYLKNGADVFAISPLSVHLIPAALASWQERKVFHGEELKGVDKIVFHNSVAPYTLVKKEQTWQVSDLTKLPKNFRLDEQAANSLAAMLTNLEVQEILTTAPAAEKTHLTAEAPRIQLLTEGAGSKAREIVLGAEVAESTGVNKDIYAQIIGSELVNPQEVVIINGDIVKSVLTRDALSLRNLKIVKLDPTQVHELTIEGAKEKLVFTKTQNTWNLTKHTEKLPENFSLSSALVDGYILRVAALTAKNSLTEAGLLTAAKASFKQPTVKVMLTLADKQVITVLVGSKAPKSLGLKEEVYYASGNIDTDVYLVEDGKVRALQPKLSEFVKAPQMIENMGNFDTSDLMKLPPDVRAKILEQLYQQQQPH